ncbi:MAG TPA: hypothetical protein V6D47_04635 [Oscillatoriaceae cyanobacterium]
MARRHTLLILGLLLAACQTPVATTTGHKLSATTKPSATQTTAASSSPSSVIASSPPPSLAPTAGPTTLLTGLAEIDASYVIAAGGGNVIAAGGGNVIAAGGGNVIAAGGGNVIAAGGGNVIAAGGGNVIAAGGGNVIAAGGGNVIAAGGGNVIAAGGGNYRLFDVASGTDASGTSSDCTQPSPSAGSVANGTILPVKGLMIVPVSMLTGRIVGPAIYTDETGHYKVSVPQAMQGNVLLIAGIPGNSADDPVVKDPRLHYDLMLTPQASASSTLNEDACRTTDYARQAIRDQVVSLVTGSDALNASSTARVASDATSVQIPGAALLQAATADLQNHLRCANVSAANLPSVADRFADLLWANAGNIETIPTSQSYGSYTQQPGELALPAATAIFREIREHAAARMACDPSFFKNTTYFADDDPAQKGVAATLPIQRPSDVCDYITAKYLTGRAFHFDDKLPPLLDALGMDGTKTKDHFRAIGVSLAAKLGVLLLDPTVKAQFDKAIDDFASASSTCPVASP